MCIVNKRKKMKYYMNICFNEQSQEPDYENKKGRIVAWTDVPLLYEIKNKLDLLNKHFIIYVKSVMV